MDHGDSRDAWRTRKVEGDLSDEIIRFAQTTEDKTQLPGHHWLLRFSNVALERAYLQTEHRRNRTYYMISMCVVTLIIASFLFTDSWLLAPSMLHPFALARIFLLLPASVLLLIVLLRSMEPLLWFRSSAASLVLSALVYSALLLIGGPNVFPYLEAAILQTVLAAFLLFGLPFRWSIFIVSFFGVSFGAATYRVDQDWGLIANFVVDFVVCTFLGATAAFRYERASRREFIANLLSRKEYSERLLTEADRRRWLEVIAAFLRHELKNTMTAISSSIELADRAVSRVDTHKYLERGRRSVHYMQQLLTKAADATNLDAALAQQEFEAVDLSDLILDRLEDFKIDTPDRAFTIGIEPGIVVFGHRDSLTQMFDKLVNNALEHGDPAFPIRIELKHDSAGYALTVSDVGDPLPENIKQLFEPFYTKKLARSGDANLGLGLFVARTIAMSHAGQIAAMPLDEAVGARFIVQLPRMNPQTASAVEPAVSPSSFSANSLEARVNL